ncbi:DUF3078 domain-containing protein [Aquirufa sp. OSTEICH-129V]|uniref:DUF3078 domain-containing protein n=1 Tax=Aquirufa avitistagni TaxID=3104728 RepID=A0ABW6DCL4_9BACT
MKSLFTFIFCLLISSTKLLGTVEADSLAQKWKKDFNTGVNLNQSSFSDNWKGGGSNTFAIGWFLNHSAKVVNNNWRLNSDLNLQVGFLQNRTQSLRKNVDRIFYEFKAGYRISPKWDFYGSTNFQSQFFKGIEYSKKNKLGIPIDSLVSNIFAPAYLTTSMGLEYHPQKSFYTRIGIGSLRQTFVFDERISRAGLYGLQRPGDNIRNQFVFQYLMNIEKDIFQNINMKARYSALIDYFRIGRTDGIVHRLDANFTMKVNKYVSTNLQAVLFRDYDQDPNWQFSQILAMGVLYRLGN